MKSIIDAIRLIHSFHVSAYLALNGGEAKPDVRHTRGIELRGGSTDRQAHLRPYQYNHSHLGVTFLFPSIGSNVRCIQLCQK